MTDPDGLRTGGEPSQLRGASRRGLAIVIALTLLGSGVFAVTYLLDSPEEPTHGVLPGHLQQQDEIPDEPVIPDEPERPAPPDLHQLRLHNAHPGELTEPGPDEELAQMWELALDSGRLVLIDATSRDFDVWLELFDDAGHLLMEDDDGGVGPTDARIIQELPAGRYLVRISSHDGRLGPFEISAMPTEYRDAPVPTRIGTEVDAELTWRHPPISDAGHRMARWVFETDRPQHVAVWVRFDADSPGCELGVAEEPEAEPVVATGGELECRVELWVEPGRPYFVRVIGFRGAYDAHYVLGIER